MGEPTMKNVEMINTVHSCFPDSEVKSIGEDEIRFGWNNFIFRVSIKSHFVEEVKGGNLLARTTVADLVGRLIKQQLESEERA